MSTTTTDIAERPVPVEATRIDLITSIEQRIAALPESDAVTPDDACALLDAIDGGRADSGDDTDQRPAAQYPRNRQSVTNRAAAPEQPWGDEQQFKEDEIPF